MPNPGTEGPAGYHHPPWPRGQPTPSSCARSIAAHRPPRRRRPAAQGRPQSRRRPLTCCRGPGELRPPSSPSGGHQARGWAPAGGGTGFGKGGKRVLASRLRLTLRTAPLTAPTAPPQAKRWGKKYVFTRGPGARAWGTSRAGRRGDAETEGLWRRRGQSPSGRAEGGGGVGGGSAGPH